MARIIAKFSAHPRRQVLFFDEGRFGLKPTLGRSWAQRGKTPHIPVKPGYTNFYLYSAVDPVKGEHFTLLLPWVNTDIMNICRNRLFDSENHLADSLCTAVNNLSTPFLASLCGCNYMSCVN